MTGLKSSKAHGNEPAEKDGEKKPQNEHGTKLKGSNDEIFKRKDGKVSAKVPDDGIQTKLVVSNQSKHREGKYSWFKETYWWDHKRQHRRNAFKDTTKRRASAPVRLADQQN